MNQTLLVQVVDARAHLDEEVEGCVLAEVLFSADEIEEVTLHCVFQRQINRFLVFKACVETAYILVIQLLLDAYLSDEGFFDLVAVKTTLLDLLDCNVHSVGFQLSQLHFTIRTFSEVGVLGFLELKVFLGDSPELLLESELLWCQAALIVCFFDEWCL